MLNENQITNLVFRALDQGRESAWFEFKRNLADFEQIAKTISAIANAATIYDRPSGAIFWGIEDSSLEIVGTLFDPFAAKQGNQSLIPWLSSQLDHSTALEFFTSEIRGRRIVILHIGAAETSPTLFRGKAFVRVDSHNMELSKQQSLERLLWKKLINIHEEDSVVIDQVNELELKELLDMELMRSPL